MRPLTKHIFHPLICKSVNPKTPAMNTPAVVQVHSNYCVQGISTRDASALSVRRSSHTKAASNASSRSSNTPVVIDVWIVSVCHISWRSYKMLIRKLRDKIILQQVNEI